MSTRRLGRGQTADLELAAGAPVPVRIGFSWTLPRRRLQPWSRTGTGAPYFDTRTACVLLDRNGHVVDQLGFRWRGAHCNALTCQDGAIEHSWSDVDDAAAPGEQESIALDLARLPSAVTTLLMMIVGPVRRDPPRSFDATCRVWDEESRLAQRRRAPEARVRGFYAGELVRYRTSLDDASAAIVMLRLHRTPRWWAATVVGAPVGRAPWVRWIAEQQTPLSWPGPAAGTGSLLR